MSGLTFRVSPSRCSWSRPLAGCSRSRSTRSVHRRCLFFAFCSTSLWAEDIEPSDGRQMPVAVRSPAGQLARRPPPRPSNYNSTDQPTATPHQFPVALHLRASPPSPRKPASFPIVPHARAGVSRRVILRTCSVSPHARRHQSIHRTTDSRRAAVEHLGVDHPRAHVAVSQHHSWDAFGCTCGRVRRAARPNLRHSHDPAVNRTSCRGS